VSLKKNATPEEKAAKRARDTVDQRNKRQRDRAAEELHERAKNRELLWAQNREALAKTDQVKLTDLLRQQDEFAGLFGVVHDLTEGLTKANVKFGEPDGLPYLDVAYQDCKEYNAAHEPAIWHPDETDFARLYRPGADKRLLAMFQQSDPAWFEYGIRTKFTVYEWQAFIRAIGDFIKNNPRHPDIDTQIAAQILVEYRGNSPVSNVRTKNNNLGWILEHYDNVSS
jgi:hypothetical protein